MGKNTRKVKLIILSIVFIITISLGVITYLNIENYKNLTESNNKLSLEYDKLCSQNETLTKNQEEKRNEIENLNNLENKLIDTKTKLFEQASTLEQKIQKKESNKKIAYLTFDDGPYYNTTNILNTLKEKGVKATFFTIGQSERGCYDNDNAKCIGQYKKIVDAGHTIANHTYSHSIWGGLYNNADSFIKQIKKQQDLIERETGVITNIMRFPGGSYQANYMKSGLLNQITAKLKEINYGYVDWTAQNGDGGDIKDENKAWTNFTGSINESIEVVLFHDYNAITTKNLSKMIDYLQNKNYILLPLFYESIKVIK